MNEPHCISLALGGRLATSGITAAAVIAIFLSFALVLPANTKVNIFVSKAEKGFSLAVDKDPKSTGAGLAQ